MIRPGHLIAKKYRYGRAQATRVGFGQLRLQPTRYHRGNAQCADHATPFSSQPVLTRRHNFQRVELHGT